MTSQSKSYMSRTGGRNRNLSASPSRSLHEQWTGLSWEQILNRTFQLPRIGTRGPKMRVKRHQISHFLKREVKNAPPSWPSLTERWQLSWAMLAAPGCSGVHGSERREQQGGERVISVQNLRCFPALPAGEKKECIFPSLRLQEDRGGLQEYHVRRL